MTTILHRMQGVIREFLRYHGYEVGRWLLAVPESSWERGEGPQDFGVRVRMHPEVLMGEGDGEASCIAVVLERGGVLFTDDLDARRYAIRCGLSVSGTLGVLALLVRDGHLSVQEADLYLERMRAAGYRSPVKSIAEIPGFPSG